MKKTKTLRDALVAELKDLYSAENQLVKALPKMVKKASNVKLKEAFTSHLEETKIHVERLEEISTLMEVKLSGKTCKAMQGLIEEGKEVLEEESDNEAFVDALLIGAAQRVEHYEMAGYGTARAMAQELGEKKVVVILDKTLEEEGATDKKLTTISVKEVLPEACQCEDSASSERVDKLGGKEVAWIIALALTVGLPIFHTSSVSAENTPQENVQEAAKHKPDNSGKNARDANDTTKTADSQDSNSKETEVLARIRREILANDSLSVNAKNVKIVVNNGAITLRGPVNSKQEKDWIEQATVKVTSDYKVINELEIADS